jgi:AraC-like DNA-binding protein
MHDALTTWSIALSGFGAALGLFFAVALMSKRPRSAADSFLAAFCAAFAVLMAGDVLVVALAPKHWVALSNAFDWVFLLLPPLFYFYVASSVRGKGPAAWAVGASLLPALPSMLWFLWRAVFAVGEPAVRGEAEDFMPASYTFSFVVVAVVQLLAYSVAAYRTVRIHARALEQRYSSVHEFDLRWIQALVWWAGAAALVWVAGVFVQHPAWSLFSISMPPLMFLALGIRAQRQRPLPPAARQAEPEPSAKYAKSGLTDERMKGLAEQLEQFMARDKAFLEGDLTLGQLADRTGIPQHQLSQVLNQHLGCSFFEYVNKLRVEEAKRCLADPAYRDQTILELGLAAGFNSKAAFNAAFKRSTGITPSEFRSKGSALPP